MAKKTTETKLTVFENKKIRKIWFNGEWWFSVIDVVGVLTDSANPRDYWFKMKIRVKSEDGAELSTICRQLKLKAVDGKKYTTDCANTESLFRIIQSVPSPKAEPFKMWLAQVGKEHIEEIENPELAQERMKQLYEQKSYPKTWIDKRLRGIAIRQAKLKIMIKAINKLGFCVVDRSQQTMSCFDNPTIISYNQNKP